MGAIEGKFKGLNLGGFHGANSTRERGRQDMNRIYLAIMAVALVAGMVFLFASVAFAEIPDPPGTIYDGGSCIEPDGSTGLVGIDGQCITVDDYDVIFGYENLAATPSQSVEGKSVAEVYGIEPDGPPASERLIGEGLVSTPRTFRQIVEDVYSGVELSIDTYRGDPGEVFHAGTVAATAGDECVTELEYSNNSPDLSEHPETDILVGPVVFTDVEHGDSMAAGLTFTATGPVNVALRIGSDGVSSGGFLVEVSCNPPTTTTSSPNTSVPSTTIAITTTTDGPSVTLTTLSLPPVGGVDAGYGSCADGACDPFDWGWGEAFLIVGALIASAGLVWAANVGMRRTDA